MEKNSSKFDLELLSGLDEVVFRVNGKRIYLSISEFKTTKLTLFDITLFDYDKRDPKTEDIETKTKIIHTIAYWIELLFKNNYKYLSFYCMNSDGKGAARKRLFQSWVDKYSNNGFCNIYFDTGLKDLFLLVDINEIISKPLLKQVFDELHLIET